MNGGWILIAFAAGIVVDWAVTRFCWRHLPDDRFEVIIEKLRASRAPRWKIRK